MVFWFICYLGFIKEKEWLRCLLPTMSNIKKKRGSLPAREFFILISYTIYPLTELPFVIKEEFGEVVPEKEI